jgi:hypothetical protein
VIRRANRALASWVSYHGWVERASYEGLSQGHISAADGAQIAADGAQMVAVSDTRRSVVDHVGDLDP